MTQDSWVQEPVTYTAVIDGEAYDVEGESRGLWDYEERQVVRWTLKRKINGTIVYVNHVDLLEGAPADPLTQAVFFIERLFRPRAEPAKTGNSYEVFVDDRKRLLARKMDSTQLQIEVAKALDAVSAAAPNAAVSRDDLAISLLVDPEDLQAALNRLVVRSIIASVTDDMGREAFLVDDHGKLDHLIQPDGQSTAPPDKPASRPRSPIAGMTDYTGVPLNEILSHIRDWRDQTNQAISNLRRLASEVEANHSNLRFPDQILEYISYFINLFERYSGDFSRLTTELPVQVFEAHVEIARQIYDSAQHEDRFCRQFKEDHIESGVKDESLRWLVDRVYSESTGMLADYRDLSNLVLRLRTFVGSRPSLSKELEQKFRILFSPAQEQVDFDLWQAEGQGLDGYTVGVLFIDIDKFKVLNSKLTESVVDEAVMPPFQHLVRDVCLQKGCAYRHGGEEFVVLLPNAGLEEVKNFAEGLRSRIAEHVFGPIDGEDIRLTVSIGVAVWPTNGQSLTETIKAANRAEHNAKDSGRNRVECA